MHSDAIGRPAGDSWLAGWLAGPFRTLHLFHGPSQPASQLASQPSRSAQPVAAASAWCGRKRRGAVPICTTLYASIAATPGFIRSQ